MAAHQLAALPGMAELGRERAAELDMRWSLRATSLDAPTSWQRSGLFEHLHHVFELVTRIFGDGPLDISCLHLRGVERPERIRLRCTGDEIEADLWLDYGARQDCLELRRGSTRVRRAGAGLELCRDGHTQRVRGSDRAWLLDAFASALRGEENAIPLSHAAASLERTLLALTRIADAGAPLASPEEPRRVSSRAWRDAP